ncbi:hypothetical protein [Marinobacter flavimaris]|uniref:hypothetical protein n=1 Tax=Marinobacter flavimaris TaxID=262076 RepID=UPI0011B0CCD8|nr:hypothetical protein [Marinobacter flavimaris]
MVKIILFGFFCLILSSTVSSETKTFKINPNWGVAINTDDFTDEKTCSFGQISDALSVLFMNAPNGNHVKDTVAVFSSNARINGIGIRYRVDKSKPVLLGQENYKYPKYSNTYLVYGKNYKKLVDDFKSGREVVYQFMSKGEPINDKVYKVNLMGFTEAYNYTIKCNSN